MTRARLAKKMSYLLKCKTKLTQEDVAKVLDIPRTAVSCIENGTREVSLYEFYKICAICNVSPDEALGWKKRMGAKDEV